MSEADLAAAFIAACRAELHALKPGNVHVHAPGHGMDITHFERSAEAAAPFIAATGEKVGVRILRAMEASFAVAGCNTNLGILLLCAPLAAAAQRDESVPLQARLQDVLVDLDAEDTAAVYAAIRLANPGGLGSVSEQDVAEAPTVGLIDAMAMAADRDRIAGAYVSGFSEIFDFGLPVLAGAVEAAGNPQLAITNLHMAFLSYFPDSHIARKHGVNLAEAIRLEALEMAPIWQRANEAKAFENLLEFDTSLKDRNINPGTTADFVVATLFAALLCTPLTSVGSV